MHAEKVGLLRIGACLGIIVECFDIKSISASVAAELSSVDVSCIVVLDVVTERGSAVDTRDTQLFNIIPHVYC